MPNTKEVQKRPLKGKGSMQSLGCIIPRVDRGHCGSACKKIHLSYK